MPVPGGRGPYRPGEFFVPAPSDAGRVVVGLAGQVRAQAVRGFSPSVILVYTATPVRVATRVPGATLTRTVALTGTIRSAARQIGVADTHVALSGTLRALPRQVGAVDSLVALAGALRSEARLTAALTMHAVGDLFVAGTLHGLALALGRLTVSAPIGTIAVGGGGGGLTRHPKRWEPQRQEQEAAVAAHGTAPPVPLRKIGAPGQPSEPVEAEPWPEVPPLIPEPSPEPALARAIDTITGPYPWVEDDDEEAILMLLGAE